MLLKPSYIFERENGEPEAFKTVDDEKINPKLRQCYDVKIKIDPFYNGRKFCVLPSGKLACQCSSSVKIVATRITATEIPASPSEDNQEDEETKPEEKDGFQVLKTYEDEIDEILTFDAHYEAGVLITAHKSNLLRLWDLNDNALEPVATKTLKSLHSNPIIHLLFDSYDGGSAAANVDVEDVQETLKWVSVSGSTLRIWELGGSQVSKAIQVDNIATIGFLRWHPGTKKRLYAAETKIYVIEFSEKTKQYELINACAGHFSQVTGIEFCGNNTMISGGRDNVLVVWDTVTCQKQRVIELPAPIEALIATSNTDLYAALNPSEIRHYDLSQDKLSSASVLNLGNDETIVAFQRGKDITSGELRFWVSTVGSTLYQLSKPGSADGELASAALTINRQFVGSLEEILAVAVWGEMKVAVANNTSLIRLYNLDNGDCKFLRGHTDIVLALSVQKGWLASGSKDNQIILWKEDADEPQFRLLGHIASVSAICFDPLRMIVYSASEDTFIKVWDQEKCLQSCVAHAKEIHSIHTSPNGAMLISSSRDKTAKIWDSDTLGLLGTLKGHKKSVWDAKFSEWDQLVVTASADTTLKIWSLPSFDCIKTLQGHTSSVLQAQFINSGLQVLSSSSDGTMRSWDIRNSLCVSTFEISEDKIWALDAVPDGTLVVLGSANSVLTVMVDVTEEKYVESMEKKNQRVEEDQRLTNCLRRGDWQHAIELALELDRPFTLLKAIREIPDLSELEDVISSLEIEHKSKLLKYIQKWNTSGRTCTEAQTLLKILLSKSSPSDVTSWVEHQALISYTQKHFNRVQKNLQNIALIKYLAES